MGQKMDPRGLRVGVINDWNSRWYADAKHFGDYVVEDNKIRTFIKKKLYVAGISKLKLKEHLNLLKLMFSQLNQVLLLVKVEIFQNN